MSKPGANWDLDDLVKAKAELEQCDTAYAAGWYLRAGLDLWVQKQIDDAKLEEVVLEVSSWLMDLRP
jgi:hypothetical protein